MVDECTHEGHRCLLAPRGYPCEPQGPVILQAVPRGVKGVLQPVLRDLDRDVVQVARGVGVVGDEVGDVLCHPLEDRQDDVQHHFRWREGVEAPVVHRCQAQPVLALQGELPVRLQLESQVGDGVRRCYPVPWSRWGQRRSCRPGTPSVVAMAHLRRLSSMPIIPRYAATASTPLTKFCSVWATTSRSSM